MPLDSFVVTGISPVFRTTLSRVARLLTLWSCPPPIDAIYVCWYWANWCRRYYAFGHCYNGNSIGSDVVSWRYSFEANNNLNVWLDHGHNSVALACYCEVWESTRSKSIPNQISVLQRPSWPSLPRILWNAYDPSDSKRLKLWIGGRVDFESFDGSSVNFLEPRGLFFNLTI